MTGLHTCNGNGTAVGKVRKYGDALSQLSKSEMEVRVLNGLQFYFGEDSVPLRATLSCWHSREELLRRSILSSGPTREKQKMKNEKHKTA